MEEVRAQLTVGIEAIVAAVTAAGDGVAVFAEEMSAAMELHSELQHVSRDGWSRIGDLPTSPKQRYTMEAWHCALWGKWQLRLWQWSFFFLPAAASGLTR